MKRSIGRWQLLGFFVTAIGGTILHFLYEWLGEAIWIAPFSAVNESTWEHMKLLFVSTFVFTIVQSFFFGDREDFWCVKLRGILLGILLIPVIFYTYNGAIAKSPDWLNIAIFFISAAVVYIYETRLFNSRRLIACRSSKFSFAVLCGLFVIFVLLTFFTPELNVFKDPMTETYGI